MELIYYRLGGHRKEGGLFLGGYHPRVVLRACPCHVSLVPEPCSPPHLDGSTHSGSQITETRTLTFRVLQWQLMWSTNGLKLSIRAKINSALLPVFNYGDNMHVGVLRMRLQCCTSCLASWLSVVPHPHHLYAS